MRTKHLIFGIAILVAVAGLWVGRVAWRAQRQLVSVDVRNAPLGEVLRKIEWQTWRKIRAERSVADVRVTLQVTGQPLREVLDLLAEQVGARWSTLYAVYDASPALERLESALRGDGMIEPAGWVKIAPSLPDLDASGARGTGPSFPLPELAPTGRRRPAGDNRPPDEPMLDSKSDDSSRPLEGHGLTMIRRGPNGAIVIQGGPDGRMEMCSPEEVLMESRLRSRLGDEATPEAAAKVARKVNGRWATYLAFRKSVMGVGSSMRMPAPPPSGQPALTPGSHPPRSRTRAAWAGAERE